MVEVRLHTIEPIDFEEALVLVSFPTTGSVAGIAGHYLQQALDLPLVGYFGSEPRSPVAAIRNGVATGTIRVFGGETECNLGPGECPRVYLVLCDIPWEMPAFAAIAQALVEACADARLILCLDGVVRDVEDQEPDVFRASSDPEVLKLLELPGVEPLREAFIAGITGQLLLHRGEGPPIGALVVEANKDIPDGRAAAAMIRAVDKLLPKVPVDAQPLLKEAEELEKAIRHARQQAEAQQPKPVNMDSFI